MKKLKYIILFGVALLFFTGCDKDFVEVNTDPFAINKMEPGLLFAGSQRTGGLNGWDSENTVAQQFVIPYNLGATLGVNFNEDIDGNQTGAWGAYTGAVKHFVHILNLLEGTSTQVNLQSMVRIWKAQVFMNLVDHYGDVPYFKAGLAAIKGEAFFYPTYDDDSEIYDDLYKELTESIADLNPAGDYVTEDLFYGSKAFYPVTTATVQVEKWKKLGNSLLLRLGMRYSKVNPTKAASIVAEAFNGGVMASNTDNTFVVYDGSLFTNDGNGGLINNNPRFYYAAEPFVDQLKSTVDPRGKFIVSSYANPNEPLNDPNPNTDITAQFGVPVGITDTRLALPPYRGLKLTGVNYSQMNVKAVASISSPTFWVTYPQTALLLAEAAKKGWIPGGDAAAQTYYEAAIRADMDRYTLIRTRTNSTLPVISDAEKAAYIAHPLVAYTPANALSLINTQYWVVNITNGSEAWANLRRTGFPVLSRNTFDDRLLQYGGGGFVHRFTYPDAEFSDNRDNYNTAKSKMGDVDYLVYRVFWDIQ